MSTDTVTLTESLRSVELFAGLPTKTLQTLADEMRTFTFVPGEVVIEEDSGGALGRMFIVLDGTATGVVAGTDIARYEPGDYFGEMSLLDGKPRSATVVASSHLTLAALASWNLRAVVQEEPSVALHIIEVLASRLRAANPTHD